MSIQPVDFLAAAQPIALPATGAVEALASQSLAAPSSFGQWFGSQLGKVDTQLEQADKQLQALASGEAHNLHQVMISLEEARLSFQLLLQVRNRALEAYQDVMRMSV